MLYKRSNLFIYLFIRKTTWRLPKTAPPRTAGSAGPFVTPLRNIVFDKWLMLVGKYLLNYIFSHSVMIFCRHVWWCYVINFTLLYFTFALCPHHIECPNPSTTPSTYPEPSWNDPDFLPLLHSLDNSSFPSHLWNPHFYVNLNFSTQFTTCLQIPTQMSSHLVSARLLEFLQQLRREKVSQIFYYF